MAPYNISRQKNWNNFTFLLKINNENCNRWHNILNCLHLVWQFQFLIYNPVFDPFYVDVINKFANIQLDVKYTTELNEFQNWTSDIISNERIFTLHFLPILAIGFNSTYTYRWCIFLMNAEMPYKWLKTKAKYTWMHIVAILHL